MRHLGFFHRLFHGLLRLLSLSDVSSHLRRADHMSGGILNRRYRDGNVELPPILSKTHGFEVIKAFAAPDVGEDLQFLFLAIPWNQSHDRSADHFFGAV